jgi:hypothetical protein
MLIRRNDNKRRVSCYLIITFLLLLAGSPGLIYAVYSNAIITTVTGTGTSGFSGDGGLAIDAQLDSPTGVAFDQVGNLYIADRFNHRIRQVIAATGIITTVAGSGLTGHGNGGFSGDGGPASEAQLNYPTHVAMDGAGNVYIADSENHRIRQVLAATGIITTVAGSGLTGNGNGGFSGDGGPATDAQLNYPSGVAVDGQGNLFIADNSNHRIRKVIAATGVITTVAGSGIAGYSGDNGPASDAQLNMPSDVAFDGVGNLYIGDQDNHCIRRVEGSGIFLKIYLPIILKNQ